MMNTKTKAKRRTYTGPRHYISDERAEYMEIRERFSDCEIHMGFVCGPRRIECERALADLDARVDQRRGI